MTCIGTWSELEASTASEAAEKAVADPEIGLLHEDDTATASTNQSAIAQAQAKYPRILALRDQKGSGECLEYRKIENSLQVSLLPRCRRNGFSLKQNFDLKGSCQEALRDKHALALGITNSSHFIILITMTVTVMIWNLLNV